MLGLKGGEGSKELEGVQDRLQSVQAQLDAVLSQS